MVEYDGRAYTGFQSQKSSPTIQAALQMAIEKATGEAGQVSAAGRTDSGAHAAGQVISCDVETRLDDAVLLRAINAHLPYDVAIQSLSTVDSTFDPRRQALSREYHYLVVNRPTRSPLWNDRAFHYRRPLTESRMQMAAGYLVGVHDFSSFASRSKDSFDPEYPPSPIREIYQLKVLRDGDIIRFRIVGSGFMQHMIRSIVGTLLLVGDGTVEPEDIDVILKSRDRSRSGPPVPAHGLYLMKVEYEAARA